MAELARAGPNGERDRLLLLTLFYSARRISELLVLTPSRMRPPDLLTLMREKASKQLPPDITVSVPAWLWVQLKEYIRTERIKPDARVFPISRVRAWQIMKGLGKATGRPYLHNHLLRHSRALDVARKTGQHAIVQGLLGHSSPQTTEIYFKYITEDQVSDVVRGLNEEE